MLRTTPTSQEGCHRMDEVELQGSYTFSISKFSRLKFSGFSVNFLILLVIWLQIVSKLSKIEVCLSVFLFSRRAYVTQAWGWYSHARKDSVIRTTPMEPEALWNGQPLAKRGGGPLYSDQYWRPLNWPICVNAAWFHSKCESWMASHCRTSLSKEGVNQPVQPILT